MLFRSWVFAQSRKKADKKPDKKTPSTDSSGSAKQLKSGEYFITQSWSQETDYKRPYFVNVPAGEDKKALPVFIFLHGDIIHYKVVNAGHGARGDVSEKLMLEFLEGKK